VVTIWPRRAHRW